MSRHDRRSTVHATRYDHRLDAPSTASLAISLAVPLLAALLISPAGPALVMSLAALALVSVAL